MRTNRTSSWRIVAAGRPRETVPRLQFQKDAALPKPPVQRLTVMMTRYSLRGLRAGLKVLFRANGQAFLLQRLRHRRSRPWRPAGQADPRDSSTTLLGP